MTWASAAGVKIGLIAIAFIVLYYRWFWKQHELSADKPEDWGHAYAVPLISLFLLWQSREKLVRTPVTSFWPGLAPLTLGIMCYFFFLVGVPNHMLQGFSLILALAGLTLFLTGPGIFRYGFLPIAYLIFGVTIAERIMIDLTFPLQLIASQGAYVILKIAGAIGGFYVEVDGNNLTVGRVPLNVAEACSGMRMIIGFAALSGAVAIFATQLWWQRIALLLIALPVAVFVNILRVAVLGLLSLKNPDLATGDAHMLIGTALLVAGLFLFLGVLWVLNRIVEQPALTPVHSGIKSKKVARAGAEAKESRPAGGPGSGPGDINGESRGKP